MNDLLVDTHYGVVTSLRRHARTDIPPGWTGWSARVSDTRRLGSKARTFRADPYGFGAALGNDEAARGAAVGEAIERYCGNAVPDDLVLSSATALRDSGLDVLAPGSLALYSSEQYGLHGFPFLPFTEASEIRWAQGRWMDSGSRVLLPAPLTYLGYYTGIRAAEPPVGALHYAGIAAGRSRAEAEMSALLELLERDATALWWAEGAPSLEIADWDCFGLRRRLADPESGSRSVRVLIVPSPFGVPVAAVWVRDEKRGLVALGTACRTTVLDAIEKALVEAFAVLAITIDLANPEGPTWQAVADGTLPAHLYKPFRPDRRYREDFDPQWRDIVDLPTVAQLYLDPRMQARAEERMLGNAEVRQLAELPLSPAIDLPQLVETLSHGGHPPASIDLTTADIAMAGLTVVRVIAPGLYNNAPAAFPLLGGNRLQRRTTTFLELPVPLA